MTNLDYEILRALEEIEGLKIPEQAIGELKAYYPNIALKPDLISEARQKYITIVKTYLIFYHIPLTIESIVAAYLWGIGNLKENGLDKTPSNIKNIIALVRHQLEPQADELMMEAEKK